MSAERFLKITLIPKWVTAYVFFFLVTDILVGVNEQVMPPQEVCPIRPHAMTQNAVLRAWVRCRDLGC